ncbi:MAG: hypothetical protein OXG56_12560 [Gammaproteobacteria bacterium]|nr:hypothetical protein [Gammaproteobacteria bacterium]
MPNRARPPPDQGTRPGNIRIELPDTGGGINSVKGEIVSVSSLGDRGHPDRRVAASQAITAGFRLNPSKTDFSASALR